MGAGGRTLRLGIALFACAVFAAAVAGRAAAQGASPRPEPSPSSGHATIHPEAAPGAQAPESSSSNGAPPTSSSAPAVRYVPAATRTVTRTVVVTHERTRTVVKIPPPRHAKPPDPPPKVSSRPLRELAAWTSGRDLLATSARGLAAPPSSGESLLLLLVGLALVVLVLGETTFLRRAARAHAPQRAVEEPLPIRRVQLRR